MRLIPRYLILLVVPPFIFLLSSCDLKKHDVNGYNDYEDLSINWEFEQKESSLRNLYFTKPEILNENVIVPFDSAIGSFNLNTGQMNWKTDLLEGLGFTTRNMILDEDHIYVYRSNSLYCLNSNSGNIVWRSALNLGYYFPNAHIQSSDNSIFLSRKNELLEIDKLSGELVHSINLDTLAVSDESPTINDILVYNDRLYFCVRYVIEGDDYYWHTGSTFCYSLDWEFIWEYKNRIYIPHPSIPGDSLYVMGYPSSMDAKDDKIYVANATSVVALDALTGDPVWINQSTGIEWDIAASGIAVGDDIVLTGNGQGLLMFFDASNGEIIKTLNLGAWVISDIFHKDHIFYLSDTYSGIWIIDSQSLVTIWNEQPPGYVEDYFEVFSSAPAIDNGYLVAVGTYAIYCYKCVE